jgi:hypothetical protein
MREYTKHLIAGGALSRPRRAIEKTETEPEVPETPQAPIHTSPDATVLDSWGRLPEKRKLTNEEVAFAEQVLGTTGLRVPTLRKKNAELRNVRLSISVTNEEASALNAMARRNGLCLSAWIRAELLGPERGRAKARSDKGTKKKKP